MDELLKQLMSAAGPLGTAMAQGGPSPAGPLGDMIQGSMRGGEEAPVVEEEAQPLDEATSRSLEEFMGKLNERMNKVQSKAQKTQTATQEKAERLQGVSQQLQGFMESPQVDSGLKGFVVDLLNQVSEKD